jgi:hypothetical protein
MSYSKISSITLYVVAVISLVVILFFYISPRTVDDVEGLDAKVDQLIAEGVIDTDEPEAPAEPAVDTAAVDTTEAEAGEMSETGTAGAESDTSMEEVDSAVVAPVVEDVEPTQAVVGEVDLKDYFTGWEIMVYKRTDYALGWAYILLAIAAIAAVLFPLINIVTDVKAILRLLMVFGGAAALVLLSYFAFASDQSIDILGYTGTANTNPVALKWIGTGLFSTYIIFGLALVSILYSEVSNLFK